MTLNELEKTIESMRAEGWRITELHMPTTLRPTYMLMVLDPARRQPKTIESSSLESVGAKLLQQFTGSEAA